MMIFIATGLLFTATFGLLMSVTIIGDVLEECNTGLKWLLTIIIALGIGFAISGALHLKVKVDADVWNGGFFPTCEEHWVPNGVTKSRNGSVTKYYYCPECYYEITQ